MRIAGATFDQIAEALGYRGRCGAHKSVTAALRKTLQEPADELRTLEAERLDRLMLATWQAATGGELDAIDRVLKIMARRARLLGLDAPDRTDITSGGERLESSQEWALIRTALMEALSAWPDARAAVATALESSDVSE